MPEDLSIYVVAVSTQLLLLLLELVAEVEVRTIVLEGCAVDDEVVELVEDDVVGTIEDVEGDVVGITEDVDVNRPFEVVVAAAKEVDEATSELVKARDVAEDIRVVI